MTKNFLWQINGNEKPLPIKTDEAFLEKDLENWIESDPTLLEKGLRIIGRQFKVEGGELDLLALHPAGGLIVVEIKRKNVHRKAIAQGLDYVACIRKMSASELESKCDEYLQRTGANTTLRELLSSASSLDQLDPQRDVVLYVVGTDGDKSDGVYRISQLLKPHISVLSVVFQIYAKADGQRILLRTWVDSDDVVTTKGGAVPVITLESVKEQADLASTGPDFRKICDAAIGFDLYPRLRKLSVMFTSQRSKNRMIFTVWANPVHKKLKVYFSPEAMADFFPISIADATALIGADGSRELDHEAVDKFLSQLKQVFDGFKK